MPSAYTILPPRWINEKRHYIVQRVNEQKQYVTLHIQTLSKVGPLSEQKETARKICKAKRMKLLQEQIDKRFTCACGDRPVTELRHIISGEVLDQPICRECSENLVRRAQRDAGDKLHKRLASRSAGNDLDSLVESLIDRI